jgi:hypothetical protein
MRRLTPLAAIAALLCAGALLSQALAAGGSLSITPSIVEHQAAPGPVAQVTVANTTGTSLKISVTPRPWLQGRSGRVVPNRKRTLLSQVAHGRYAAAIVLTQDGKKAAKTTRQLKVG